MPKTYGTDQLWHSQEIHALVALADTPQTASGMAKRLGITRSAATQLIQRLEGKEVLTRYSLPGNKKEKLPSITAKGKEILAAHRQFHERVEAPALEALAAQPRELRASIELLAALLNSRATRILNEFGSLQGTTGVQEEQPPSA